MATSVRNWSTLKGRLGGDALLLRGSGRLRDSRWLKRVTEPLSAGDLRRQRLSVERGRPCGDHSWTKATAQRWVWNRPYGRDGDPESRKSKIVPTLFVFPPSSRVAPDAAFRDGHSDHRRASPRR